MEKKKIHTRDIINKVKVFLAFVQQSQEDTCVEKICQLHSCAET